MADTLIKLKTGTIEKLAQRNANDTPVVPLDKGTVYFAVDTVNHIGKLVYDAPAGTNGVDRIVMSSQSERADEAVHAASADMANKLAVARNIDGVKFDGSANIVHYGTCDTAAATGAKTVTCNGFTLVTGAWIAVKFNVTNTAATSNLTLNVSSTGAKGIKYRNANLPEPGDLAANRVYLFVYDGTYYQWVGDRNTDTNTDTTYDPVQANGNPGLMSGADKAKLDNIAEFADNVSFSRSLSSGTKIGTITINGTSTDLYSTNNTWTAFKGATASAAGTAGYINAVPAAGETGKYFGSDGAWHGNADSGTTGLMSAAYASKLDGIAIGAEVNQNTFANVKVGSTTIAADAKQDTLELVGSNVTLTPDATNDKVTIGITKANVTNALGYTPPTTNTTYGLASSSSDGLMPKEAYDKLQNIADFAKNTTISATSPIIASASTGAVSLTHATSGPSTSSDTSKGDTSNQTPTWGDTFKVTSGTVDKFGHTKTFAEHTVTIPSAVATSSISGLMSAADKAKLDTISQSAKPGTVTSVATGVGLTGGTITGSGTIKAYLKSETKATYDSATVTNTENRQYAVTPDKIGYLSVNIPWVDTTYNAATSSAAGLMSAADKAKLDGIATNAKNTTISATTPIIASASTGSVSITHAANGPSSTANTSKGDTSNQTPEWGGTFKVTSGTVDKFGHTTVFADHTVTIPSSVATTSANGLMSKADKAKIDGGVTIAGNNIAIGGSITADTLRTSLGLSNAMHFIGVATVAITDGSTTDPAISGYSTKIPGDVVIDKDSSREYVWSTAGKWEELGPDGSYALSNHIHNNATSSTAGFMSAADKAKLDGISSGAKPGTVTSVATGVGLTGGTITTSGTIKVKLRSETALSNDSAAATETAGRVYPIVPDKSGYLAVNVPWVNTTYSNATSSAAGLMSAADKAKLDGVASGAQVNVIETVKMNGTALTISSKAVNIPLMGAATSSTAGTVGVVPAPAAGKETSFLRGDGTWVIPTDTKYNNATSSTAGLMSAADKVKLDSISANARTGTVTSVATGAGLTGGTITTSGTLKVNIKSETKLDIDSIAAVTTGTTNRVYPVLLDKTGYLAVNVPWVNTTYNAATTSTTGLMSAADKAKLDGIATGAKTGTVISVATGAGLVGGTITTSGTLKVNLKSETKLDIDSITAVTAGTANRVYPILLDKTGYLAVNVPWSNTTYNAATTSAAGLMSAADKTKLDNIAANAKNTTISATGPIAASASTGAVTISHNASGVSANTYGTIANDDVSPGFGINFLVPAFTVNATGHITAAGVHNVKIPATAATQSAAGLMSATDKAKLDNIAANAKTGTVTSVATGVGLTGGTITTTGTIKVKLRSETALTLDSTASGNTADRVYAVAPDKSGYLAVTVPWVNDWRPVADNLTSTSTTTSLSANQGRLLANGSARDNTKLPLAGGTMTGDITFTDTTFSSNPTDSKGLVWSGGTDGAKIFYRQTANNDGRLVLQVSDDGNELITFRHTQGGQIYVAPNTRLIYPDTNNQGSVGTSSYKWNAMYATTFHGSLDGNATSANTAGTATTAGKFTSAQSITLTGDTTGSASSQAGWNIATTTKALSYNSTLSTIDAVDAFMTGDKIKVAKIAAIDGLNGLAKNDGMIISVPWSYTYGHQFYIDDTSYSIAHRFTAQKTITNDDGTTSRVQDWRAWKYILDEFNYTSYTVKKDGTGASGTWNISISGTATKATQDESGNNIKASYAHSLSISDHTITLKNMNNASLGTVTVPDNDTKNTAGSTDTSSKIFLIGATTQAANPQTYSDNQVYATNGQLDANKVRVAEHVILQYNTTTQSLDFIFA